MSEGEGYLQIDDSKVTVVTRAARCAAHLKEMSELISRRAAETGVEVAQLNDDIAWLTEVLAKEQK